MANLQDTENRDKPEEAEIPDTSRETEAEDNFKETKRQLSDRSNHVNRQLHRIGLVISMAMLICTLVLLVMAIYKVYVANEDFVNGTVTHITLSKINEIVASVLLMMVTSLTALIFFRLYKEKSPFTRGNIFAVRVVAVMLMLLSFLPVTIQAIVGLFLNIGVGLNMNWIYIFIGVVFYSISYIFEQGDIIKKKSDELIGVQETIILRYAEVSETKTGQNAQHVKRMSEYSRVLAKNIGMSEAEAEVIRLASIMHDIGKVLIPIEILERESSLNDEEFAIMKTHVVAGEELLQNATGEVMEEARRIALDHHEHWDGTGYLGKKGKEISRSAQIVSIADMFDSMIGARVYKKGWEMNKVYSTISAESGKKFDPEVVEAFTKSYKEMESIYSRYNKNIVSDYELPEEIIESYDKLLGEYSPRLKPADQEVQKENSYQDVELDLRRLI